MLARSVAFNINIGVLRALRIAPWLPIISTRKAKRRARAMVEQLGIKINDLDQPIGSLSGGNQQKALIARWLTPHVRVLFLDEPSRGVDVGARRDIHRAIRDLADRGIAVVVISSDVEELVMLCDRVVVLHEGRVGGVVDGADLSEESVVELSYGHSVAHGAAV
jgi:ribose transport system ATP-binding protein